MISLIIPSYRNPQCLDLCLKSVLENQKNKNEIIVAVDGFIEESQEVLDKYKEKVNIIDLGQNQGMQQALNLGVMNATNERIMIINDDNVLCNGWDSIWADMSEGEVKTINQIEPTGPGIFNFPTKDFGSSPNDFNYEGFLEYEKELSSNKVSDDGGIFPFVIFKKNYMMVGGFDTLYQSPFICDWDVFLKLELGQIRSNTRTPRISSDGMS